MSHGMGYIPALFKYLPKDLDGLTILDAGAGLGEVGYYIKAFSDHHGCDLHGQPYLIGVDIHGPNVKKIKTLLPQIYEEAHQLDISNLYAVFKNRKIHVLTCNSTIEHIEKEKALTALSDFEKLSSYVFISTPLGDYTHESLDDVSEFNHVSAWYPEDFTKRGYVVTIKEVIDFGSSPIAKAYRLARNLFGTKIRRKIYAVRNKSGLTQSRGYDTTGRREATR